MWLRYIAPLSSFSALFPLLQQYKLFTLTITGSLSICFWYSQLPFAMNTYVQENISHAFLTPYLICYLTWDIIIVNLSPNCGRKRLYSGSEDNRKTSRGDTKKILLWYSSELWLSRGWSWNLGSVQECNKEILRRDVGVKSKALARINGTWKTACLSLPTWG